MNALHVNANIGTRLAAVISIVVLALLAAAAPAAADPGDIVSIELEQTMLPGQIDWFVGKLYAGYLVPKASYTVDVYWVRFRSTYPDGQPAVAQAQVFVPRYVSGRQAVRVLYAFGPGSTGVIDSCRPSREHVAGIRWGLYRAHVLSHVGQGVIGVIPDYLGFGDPDRDQYYMVAQAEAAAMLDSIRATKALLAVKKVHGVTDTRNFVAGFSQGGHAAFAAADYRESYAPELELDGVIGYGPSTDLVALFKEFPDVAPMILYTFRNLYGKDMVDPDRVLLGKFAVNLDDDITRQCVGGMQSYYPTDPEKLFRPEFAKALLEDRLAKEYPGIFKALRANSVGLGGHGVPALICQGTDDIVVYDDTQRAFAAALEASGVDTRLAIYPGSRHDTRQVSFVDVQKWMRAALVSRGAE
jgi:acetyl esterase/lipase